MRQEAQQRQRREHAKQIFAASLRAADPGACMHRVLHHQDGVLRVGDTDLDLDDISRLVVVGAGKAAAAMALAAEEVLGARISAGTINTKYGHTLPLHHLTTVECGHPLPDEAGVQGTRVLLDLLRDLDERAVVLCLLSGGGSALLPAPAPGLSLADKQATTEELLRCGASIDEVNTIRKHLSRVKGGLLARRAQPARLFTLALSDVIGDPLDTIASGPTYPDASTFADCQRIVDRYGLAQRLPASVSSRLQRGAAGEIPETPKADDPCFLRTRTRVIGNNALAVAAAEQAAQELGYHTLVLSTRLQGEAREIATALAAIAQEITAAERPLARPACVICGGETTVTLRGTGKGGRNQELALAAAVQLDGVAGITLLSGGTDGTDGPTDAAGAVVDGGTLSRARTLGLEAQRFLQNNDSYPFLQAVDALLLTGPTQTNVMDLQIILVS